MVDNPQQLPECFGKIQKHFGWTCSTECPYTMLCVHAVMDTLMRQGYLR